MAYPLLKCCCDTNVPTEMEREGNLKPRCSERTPELIIKKKMPLLTKPSLFGRYTNAEQSLFQMW